MARIREVHRSSGVADYEAADLGLGASCDQPEPIIGEAYLHALAFSERRWQFGRLRPVPYQHPIRHERPGSHDLDRPTLPVVCVYSGYWTGRWAGQNPHPNDDVNAAGELTPGLPPSRHGRVRREPASVESSREGDPSRYVWHGPCIASRADADFQRGRNP